MCPSCDSACNTVGYYVRSIWFKVFIILYYCVILELLQYECMFDD